MDDSNDARTLTVAEMDFDVLTPLQRERLFAYLLLKLDEEQRAKVMQCLLAGSMRPVEVAQ